MKNKKKVKVTPLLLSLILSGAILVFAPSCTYEAAVQEEYDIIRQSNDGLAEAGITQELKVEGEEFKLIAEYRCNSDKDNPSSKAWLITTDKNLYMTVRTDGLEAGYEVYLDNIHIDTFILADLAAFNGVKQDSMDDRVHSSSFKGFYIDDDSEYFGINIIEGMNQEFIEGTYYAYLEYGSGTITQKRYSEQDYRDKGVWGNKISIVYDLMIKGPNDADYRNVSVGSEIVVEASPYKKELLTIDEAKQKRLEKQGK